MTLPLPVAMPVHIHLHEIERRTSSPSTGSCAEAWELLVVHAGRCLSFERCNGRNTKSMANRGGFKSLE